MQNSIAALTLTREIVRITIINPPGKEDECARHLGRVLENAG